jgi:predicted phage tail protein
VAGSAQFAIGTAASLVMVAPASSAAGATGWFYAVAGTAASVYLGASGVTSSNGAALAAGGTLSGFLFPGDQVYALTASGTSTLAVLQTGA